jgi:uncharacterized protein YndB with AHSA1/START domain
VHVIGSRERTLPAPPHVVWRSLTDPNAAGSRPWLRLLEDEIEPRVLASEEPELVVWSSLWPRRPHDVVRLDLRPHDHGTAVRWSMTTDAEPPDESATGHIRHRLNHLLWSDLRLSYGQ